MSEKSTAINRDSVLTYEVTGGERLSDGVVAAVAAVSDTDPTAMDPLAESVDPDALDALFAAKYDGTPRATGSVRLSYSSYDVVVTGAGHVTVFDPDL